MKKFNFKNQRRKGFGLLEVLLSAVIIIIILAALVTIGRAALNNNENLIERSQATYFAQEGIEMVRQIRDTNWIDGDNTSKWDTLVWASSAYTTTDDSKEYGLQYEQAKFRVLLLESPAGDELTLNNVKYTRKITVNSVDSSDLIPNGSGTNLKPYALKVTSTVTWNFSGQPKTIELSELITNWRPDF